MIIGILSIIAGVFVLFQSFTLVTLTSIVRTGVPVAICFVVIAVCFLTSGTMAIIYSIKKDKKFLLRCVIVNAIAVVAPLTYIAGDLVLWRSICLVLVAYYLARFWYIQHREEVAEEAVSDPERLAQNNPAGTVSADAAPECNGEDYPNP